LFSNFKKNLFFHNITMLFIYNCKNTSADKIAGSATPFAGELGQYKLSWALSTGETLIISRRMHDLDWERHLDFSLKVPGPGLVRPCTM
jgi:hypothetical protein